MFLSLLRCARRAFARICVTYTTCRTAAGEPRPWASVQALIPPSASAFPAETDSRNTVHGSEPMILRFRDWAHDALNFDPHKWPHADLRQNDEDVQKVADLRGRLNRLLQWDSFKVGDIVQWKPGLRPSHTSDGPMIVSRVRDRQKLVERNASRGLEGVDLDDVMILVIEDDHSAYEMWAESRRLMKV